jgi:hypothetical protein
VICTLLDVDTGLVALNNYRLLKTNHHQTIDLQSFNSSKQAIMMTYVRWKMVLVSQLLTASIVSHTCPRRAG